MHQIRFRLGFCPRPRWGRLQRSPRLLAGFKELTYKGKKESGRKRGRDGGIGEGKGRGRKESWGKWAYFYGGGKRGKRGKGNGEREGKGKGKEREKGKGEREGRGRAHYGAPPTIDSFRHLWPRRPQYPGNNPHLSVVK